MFRVRTFCFAIVAALAACGGGGKNDECNYSVACIQPDPATIVDSTELLGAYDIQYQLSLNSCVGATPLRQLRERYEATSGFGYHGYPTIEISSSTGLNYSSYSSVDNTDGRTYFLDANESGSQELSDFIPSMRCSESITLDFVSIGQGRATATRTSSIDCAKPDETIGQGSSGHCEVVYNGEGSFTAR